MLSPGRSPARCLRSLRARRAAPARTSSLPRQHPWTIAVPAPPARFPGRLARTISARARRARPGFTPMPARRRAAARVWHVPRVCLATFLARRHRRKDASSARAGALRPTRAARRARNVGPARFLCPGRAGCTACPIGFISKLSGQASNASCVSCAPGERWKYHALRRVRAGHVWRPGKSAVPRLVPGLSRWNQFQRVWGRGRARVRRVPRRLVFGAAEFDVHPVFGGQVFARAPSQQQRHVPTMPCRYLLGANWGWRGKRVLIVSQPDAVAPGEHVRGGLLGHL